MEEILMKLSMSFLIKDNKLLEKYNLSKVSKIIKKRFDNEPVYKERYLKTKVTSYEGKINKIFIMKKEGPHCIFLSVVLVDSAFKMGKYHYTQVFLEECKYIVNEK